ncbi:MAG: sigma factor-like helix-turn-helix DNA-binding protein [Candidatus Nanoarchaeia archaeon]
MLTEKEIEVLRLRKASLTQVEVAKKLGISQAAVSSFEKNALKKIEDAENTFAYGKKIGSFRNNSGVREK